MAALQAGITHFEATLGGQPAPQYAYPGLKKVKAKLGEKPGQKFPSDRAPQAVLPEKYRAK